MGRSNREDSSSYVKSDIQDDNPSELVDDEHNQLPVDKLQIYLSHMYPESGCWSKIFPKPFERASQKSWWDPTFDSEILEGQFKKSSNIHNKVKFRYALLYLIVISSTWLAYFSIVGFLGEKRHRPLLCSLLLLLIVCLIISLVFTYTDIYDKNMTASTSALSLLITMLSLVFLIICQSPPDGNFSLCIQILFLLYTLVPLKLYVSLILGVLYSMSFELVVHFLQPADLHSSSLCFVRLLCHFGVHVIGFHIGLMNTIRTRNTFMKVGQSLLVRRQLESEKRLKENMIHSLMPKSVADWLKKEDENFIRRQSSDSTNDIRSLFRPFNMDHMENVSILFADIVGFTRMSSKKSAEELVDILNDLFQRFDLLCKVHNCEKISTLGDCYYCVSGCPEARPDHARCTVEMGLAMIQAIRQFEEERSEGVNMRVGIHTGTVLCGIVGTRRFKFDVWSNDVTLANKMESTGKPGMVHVSEKTVDFLQDTYLLEEGENVMGQNTYFIMGRKHDKTPTYSGSFRAEGRQKYTNSLQLIVSPPCANATGSPQSRPRVLSCDTPTTASNHRQASRNFLSPDVCKIKASSLPSILDMEDDGGLVKKELDAKTPTSTASSGKCAGKRKNWKITNFMKKLADQKQEGEGDVFTVVSSLNSTDDGYQQVPTIIEAKVNGIKDSFTNLKRTEGEDVFKDTIDIKSYISQSRSDIGQFEYPSNSEFIRSGSYRSQYSRSPAGDFSLLTRTGSNRSRRSRSPMLEGIEPRERARSATVSASNLQRPKRSFDLPSRLSSIAYLEENLNQSRKDSGIRSNSRRSSLQTENAPPNSDILHRVSGYYTSSQCSINAIPKVPKNHGPFFDKYGVCIQNLRKQSDRQLIKCVQDNSKSRSSYFIKPPLSKVTLFFKDADMERQYRNNVHHIPKVDSTGVTLTNSNFNTYLDVVVSMVTFFVVSTGTALVYGVTRIWQVTFVALLACQLLLGVALSLRTVVRWFDRVFWCFIRFYRWNLFGAMLVVLPLISAIANFTNEEDISAHNINTFSYLIFVGFVHFLNFTQLNCWMKSLLATSGGSIIAFIFVQTPCSSEIGSLARNASTVSDSLNVTGLLQASDSCYLSKTEVGLNLLLLLILIWLLTRGFEIGYRVSFHANFVANRDKNKVQSLKNQADYLIYNIVPEHVAEQLKKDAKYSENFKDVAIIFASIVNFNEMYDESYEGGREYLRVLNELIGDFDELLDWPEFDSVEKIKTIGSTFMAASGLDSRKRRNQKDPNEHLFALMDFALELQNVVNAFNRNLLGFDLELRVGYNFGDVTAAVIGNTKLFYDIWGDAVNIASRMDSTGKRGRIQVGEMCLAVLEEKYEFEPRGSVYVKGKDHMNVYFVKKKRTPPFLSVPDS